MDVFRFATFACSSLESALQHVAMFIRSMNSVYQLIEPLPDFGRKFHAILFPVLSRCLGWRYNKTHFLASKTGCPNERYLLTWVISTVISNSHTTCDF